MATGDLVSLASVKAWLNVASANDDAVLKALITQVSRAIFNNLNRSVIFPKTVTEYYDGNWNERILLRNWPVGLVSQVLIDGAVIPARPAMVAGSPLQSGWFLEDADPAPPGSMQLLHFAGYRCPKGRQNIAVTYRAGYEIVAEAATISTPGNQITTQQPFGTWASDSGVTFASGAALSRVSADPVAGQYTVDANGTYGFSVSDQGKTVLISYAFVPAELERVALEWVAERYKYRDRIGMRSKSLGGQETVSFDNRAMPEIVSQILTNYRRVVPC